MLTSAHPIHRAGAIRRAGGRGEDNLVLDSARERHGVEIFHRARRRNGASDCFSFRTPGSRFTARCSCFSGGAMSAPIPARPCGISGCFPANPFVPIWRRRGRCASHFKPRHQQRRVRFPSAHASFSGRFSVSGLVSRAGIFFIKLRAWQTPSSIGLRPRALCAVAVSGGCSSRRRS